MTRAIATLLTGVVLAFGIYALRAVLHGRQVPTGTPFEQCMARARKSFGPGTLPDSIRRQFTMDCEAQFRR